MELGKRLKQARLEAGLSQRQLCGDAITRNMLSQIENGAARPSMDTLRYLAGRLGKSMSYFLEENAVLSPNQALMEQAREAFARGKWERVCSCLEGFREPDAAFVREKCLLNGLAVLALAQNVVDDGRGIYAAELLEGLEIAEEDYCARELRRRKLLLLAKTGQGKLEEICQALPGIDEELMIRARNALERGDGERAGALLDAAEDRETPEWNFLRGEAHLALGQFASAVACYHRAEERWPEQTASRLERCYRELEDFRMAYFYACKQRE